MILKVLFFVVLIYFIAKTAARLLLAMQGKEQPLGSDREKAPRREGATPPRTFDEEDVEDAKFVDV